MSATVIDVPEAKRYEARLGSTLAGFADYIRTARLIVFTHTEVDAAYKGQGIGSTLARAALDDARARGLRVLAPCPFIADWIGRHPGYEDLAYDPQSRVSD